MSTFLSAVMLGISVAAPVGPVGLAVIRTVLVRGPVTGWLVGLGAAAADTAYLVLAFAGVTPLLLHYQWVGLTLAVAGTAILLRLAWQAGRAADMVRHHADRTGLNRRSRS